MMKWWAIEPIPIKYWTIMERVWLCLGIHIWFATVFCIAYSQKKSISKLCNHSNEKISKTMATKQRWNDDFARIRISLPFPELIQTQLAIGCVHKSNKISDTQDEEKGKKGEKKWKMKPKENTFEIISGI